MSTTTGDNPSERCVDHEDGFETGSLSDSFFRGPLDSAPPVVETIEPEELQPRSAVCPSPALVARRARLRRMVAMLVAAAGVFAFTAVGRSAIASRALRSASARGQGAAQVTQVPVRAVAAAPSTNVQQPLRKLESEAAPAPVEQLEQEPMPDPVEGARLRKQATSLLERGKVVEAIEVAEAATVADPSHATAWLLLGTALQSTGKWKQGAHAYNRCAQMATKGPIWECRAMGGR